MPGHCTARCFGQGVRWLGSCQLKQGGVQGCSRPPSPSPSTPTYPRTSVKKNAKQFLAFWHFPINLDHCSLVSRVDDPVLSNLWGVGVKKHFNLVKANSQNSATIGPSLLLHNFISNCTLKISLILLVDGRASRACFWNKLPLAEELPCLGVEHFARCALHHHHLHHNHHHHHHHHH